MIIEADEAGIIQVAAAGNDPTKGVSYPGAYDETIAVSATEPNDDLASFSGFGLEIDMAAPGMDIYSTYKGGGYKTMSGTSMACPHVTGTVALALSKGLIVQTGLGLQKDDDLKGEWIDKLLLYQQGEGLVDAETTVVGGAAKPLPEAQATWGEIKSLFR